MAWSQVNFTKIHLGIPRRDGVFRILHNVDVSVRAGEVLGILGESGSGKSLSMRSLAALLEWESALADVSADGGRALGPGRKSRTLRSLGGVGQNLLPDGCVLSGQVQIEPAGSVPSTESGSSDWAQVVPSMASIFQDAKACLNPSLRVGEILAEIMMQHSAGSAASETSTGDLNPSAPSAQTATSPKTTRSPWLSRNQQAIIEALKGVRLPSGVNFRRRFPHELSGGMQQRLAIACVLAANTDIIVADEALSALDRETSAGIADLFRYASRALGKAVLVVSHDLRLIEELCDSVLVMYAGHVLEHGASADFFRRPRHPYSRALQASQPGRFVGNVEQEAGVGQEAAALVTAQSREGVGRAQALSDAQGSESGLREASAHRSAGQKVPAHVAGRQAHPEIAGEVSPAGTRFAGCPFADRCERKQSPCENGLPAMQGSEGGGFRCLYPED